jgi:hypothetical protein
MLPAAWGPYLWLAWPIFVVCLLAGVGLLIWQLRIEERIAPPSQADQLQTQSRLPFPDRDGEAAPEPPAEPVPDVPPHREDWGEAVDVEIFYGRDNYSGARHFCSL